jgi:hypothetical protein
MSAEEERIAAFLHIAASDDLMLSSPIAVRQKLFAVRCVKGEKAEELREEVESLNRLIGLLRPENRGGDLEKQLRGDLRIAQDVYDAYMRDVAVVTPWLEREDAALYKAAKQASTAHRCCGSEQTYNAEIRAWIDSIAPAAKRRRVARKK